jgi:hypothetical protein
MSKETTVSRATPAKPAATSHAAPGSEETRPAAQAALRNAPTTCISNGDDKQAGRWRTG